jgi:methylamine--corrinoid protein Co-methyltransferase
MPGGMRTCDSHECSQLNELKIDTNALCFTSFYKLQGDVIMIEQMPLFGGWAGDVEQVAINNVATHIASFVLLSGDWHLDGPVHVRWGITTAREALMIAGYAGRAMDKYTHCLLGNQYYTAAGPGTEMCLLEAAAQAATDTMAGREIISGCASLKGTQLDYTTPIESRVMGYMANAVAGMPLEKANPMVDKLVALYEKNFEKAAKTTELRGKTIKQVYDMTTLLPTPDWLETLDKAMKTMEGLGFKFKSYA